MDPDLLRLLSAHLLKDLPLLLLSGYHASPQCHPGASLRPLLTASSVKAVWVHKVSLTRICVIFRSGLFRPCRLLYKDIRSVWCQVRPQFSDVSLKHIWTWRGGAAVLCWPTSVLMVNTQRQIVLWFITYISADVHKLYILNQVIFFLFFTLDS